MDAVVALKSMDVSTPEILWHGGKLLFGSVINERALQPLINNSLLGTNENGKADPVYSVDMHRSNVLATAGINEKSPPMGCARLWLVDSKRQTALKCFLELADHESVVNSVRFSPCGFMLATASDRRVVVYRGTKHRIAFRKKKVFTSVVHTFFS